MAKIEGFRIMNFKTLKDVTLGYVLSNQRGRAIDAYDGSYWQEWCGEKRII